MASNCEKCSFCHSDMSIPQNGWCLKDRTYAKLCSRCSTAFKDGTLCQLYHQQEDGWRSCDDCGKLVHCGCIMALHTFEVNDSSGVNCEECSKKKNPVVCSQLEDCCSSTDFFPGEECLADPWSAKPFSYVLHNPVQATIEGSSKMYQLSTYDIFLFEKKLTPTDCDVRAGRLLVPKVSAEKFFPHDPAQQSAPISIEDIGGTSWHFILRWWVNKRSRKYVLDGTRTCAVTMQWTVGDTLKFYRKNSDDSLVMKLEKTCATSSGCGAALHG